MRHVRARRSVVPLARHAGQKERNIYSQKIFLHASSGEADRKPFFAAQPRNALNRSLPSILALTREIVRSIVELPGYFLDRELPKIFLQANPFLRRENVCSENYDKIFVTLGNTNLCLSIIRFVILVIHE